jgi:hypothetical protein
MCSWCCAPLAIAGTQGTAARPFVTQAEFSKWQRELSNWGRWGKDDQAGALNHDYRREAARNHGARQGRRHSLAMTSTKRGVENPTPTARRHADRRMRWIDCGGSARIPWMRSVTGMFSGKIYSGFHDGRNKSGRARRSHLHRSRRHRHARRAGSDLPALKGVPFLSGTRIFIEISGRGRRSRREGLVRRAFIRTGRWVRAKTGASSTSDTLSGRVRDSVAGNGRRAAGQQLPWTPGHRAIRLGLAVHDSRSRFGVHVIDNCDLTALAGARTPSAGRSSLWRAARSGPAPSRSIRRDL